MTRANDGLQRISFIFISQVVMSIMQTCIFLEILNAPLNKTSQINIYKIIVRMNEIIVVEGL